MGCNSSSQGARAVQSSLAGENRHQPVKLTNSRPLGSPRTVPNGFKASTVPLPHSTSNGGAVASSQRTGLPPVRQLPRPDISRVKEELEKEGPARQTASASSQISNISTASRGISYDLRVPGGGGAAAAGSRPPTRQQQRLNDPSIPLDPAAGRLPPALQKRLNLTKDSQLTMNKLEEKLQTAKERRERLMIGRKETATSYQRPKTAQAKERQQERVQTARATRLEADLSSASQRRDEQQREVVGRQHRREERAQRVRQRAETLQNPEFIERLDTFGENGNIEAPLSPAIPRKLPPIQNSPPRKAKSFDDDFFD